MYGLTGINNVEKFSLESVSVDCDVRNLLVMCTSTFVYKNKTGQNAEGMFSFPLEGSCVVYHFEAEVGGKTIIGVCKEIEEAKNLYKAATEAGQKAAIIERVRSMNDVFNCRIGNMPKNSEAKIILKFAMELKLSLSKSDCENVDRFNLCLPLILRPRYTPTEYDGDVTVYHVSNKYEYSFQALLTGTKEIKNVFSNNHQLKFTINNDIKTVGQVILESKYDGTHDLDVNIDFIKMRVPSILYEFGTSSSGFHGNTVHGAFYKTDVAMLNFLPEFEKKTEIQNKLEIVIVVDRSGSMEGSNIEHAKECLLIFLKSLPTNCKFQIYGFGSTFDKVFPLPQLYDDQSIEIAMNYQRNLEANLGGTELMNPLKDLYSATLSGDYTRVVFLLTDGDVGNQDEVFKLVRQHNQSTRLFTVGIGEGASTSLVQKVAESGNGKSVFVRDSKTLSSSVIELLDIALNCDQFTDCKIEWQCPKDVSVVMVPSNPGPIFSNYFLTFFCMINGLKERESIKCHLSGKVNDKSISLSLDVNGKEGISDNEFRVHRLLAKYKIDEMTSQINDGQEDLKKSLIELSLEVNMVTNYTTFVAIDKDVPEQILGVEEPEIYDLYSSNAMCYSLAMTSSAPRFSHAVRSRAVFSQNLCRKKKSKKALEKILACSMPACLGENSNERFDLDEYRCFNDSEVNIEDIVVYLADKQNINGSWTFNEDILKKLGIDSAKFRGSKSESISDEVWMTVIVYQYILTKLMARENEWRLFVKKTKQWLNGSVLDPLNLDKIMEEALAVI